jgi:hypothetical protein
MAPAATITDAAPNRRYFDELARAPDSARAKLSKLTQFPDILHMILLAGFRNTEAAVVLVPHIKLCGAEQFVSLEDRFNVGHRRLRGKLNGVF